MRTYAALLRGVNVGKNKLAMADLRALLTDLGGEDVRTYLQSGNAVFGHCHDRPAAWRRRSRKAWPTLGVSSRVLLRTGKELAGVLAGNPYLAREADPAKLHVTFLAEAPDRTRLRNCRCRPARPHFHLAGKEVYLHCPDGYGRTKLTNSFFESRLGTVATTRNWRTVTALAELTGAS